jgi:hypothetical protein
VDKDIHEYSLEAVSIFYEETRSSAFTLERTVLYLTL